MSWAEVKMAVKSIQRGYTTVANSDVTITLGKSVDPSRCIVLLDGDCGTAVNNSTGSYTRYGTQLYLDSSRGYAFQGLADSKMTSGNYVNTVNTTFLYGVNYAAARKPYVKALTETQLTIGQSGTYGSNINGTTVSYQVIEFFN